MHSNFSTLESDDSPIFLELCGLSVGRFARWPVGRYIRLAFDLFVEVNNPIFLFFRFTLEP